MIDVNIEIASIARIEADAAQAFSDGKPDSANPYRAGSTSHRVWGMFFDSCQRATPTAETVKGDA